MKIKIRTIKEVEKEQALKIENIEKAKRAVLLRKEVAEKKYLEVLAEIQLLPKQSKKTT